MAKKLTPEEKAAREIQKRLDKEAARIAKIEARRAQWAAEALAARTAFEASLSEEDKQAIYTILRTSGTKVDLNTGLTVAAFESEFIESLTNQLHTRGFLSPAQLAPVVNAYKRKVEFEAQKVTWPSIAEGDDVQVLCTVIAMEHKQGAWGPTTKIKMRSHYGRIFHVNTMAERFLSVARAAKEQNLPINVQGKAGWISPDTRIVVLDKKGLYFQGL